MGVILEMQDREEKEQEVAAGLAARVAAGRAAKEAGAAFEKKLDLYLATLRQQRIVEYVEKNGPQWARRGRTYVRTQASGADRAGILRDARAFALEAKSTGHKDGKVKAFEQKRISPKQKEHLDAAARVGAPAMLLLEWRLPSGEGRWFFVPWSEMNWRGKKSVRMAEMLAWMISPDDFCARFRSFVGQAPAVAS